MPRKPTLSPSKITTYLACPFKYRWTYVDDRGKWYLRSKSYFSFGTTLHRVLQKFHDSGETGVTTTEEVLAAYEESWIDAGFSSAEEMAEAYGEGKAILESYVAVQSDRVKAARTLFLERQFRHDLGEFVLIGRVDRVDEHDDGSLEIIDYKSKREEVSDEEVRSDIAMTCYQLLLKRKFPERRVTATILALRSGNHATVSMSDQELNEFESDLRNLGLEILNETYESLEPVFKSLCPRCDFIPLCRKYADFTESSF